VPSLALATARGAADGGRRRRTDRRVRLDPIEDGLLQIEGSRVRCEFVQNPESWRLALSLRNAD